jgi:hypothetical protein
MPVVQLPLEAPVATGPDLHDLPANAGRRGRRQQR